MDVCVSILPVNEAFGNMHISWRQSCFPEKANFLEIVLHIVLFLRN